MRYIFTIVVLDARKSLIIIVSFYIFKKNFVNIDIFNFKNTKFYIKKEYRILFYIFYIYIFYSKHFIQKRLDHFEILIFNNKLLIFNNTSYD